MGIFYYAFSKPEYTYPPLFLIYLMSFMIVPIVVVINKYRNVGWCFYLPFYGLLQIIIITIGITTSVVYSLPPASAMILTAEMARMSMKMHAYFREKIVNGINRDGEIAKFIP